MKKLAPQDITDYKPTETRHFTDGTKKLSIDIVNTDKMFTWRLTVDGKKSLWYNHYTGIMEFMGYCVATEFWEDQFPAFTPFKIQITQTAPKPIGTERKE